MRRRNSLDGSNHRFSDPYADLNDGGEDGPSPPDAVYSALNNAATRRLGLILAEILRPPVRGVDSHDGATSGVALG